MRDATIHVRVWHGRARLPLVQPGAGPSQVTVVVGTNDLTQGGIKHKSKRLIVHPDYSGYDLTNDIGLIELDSPLNFSSKVSKISLPNKDIKIPLTPVVVTGWGQTSPTGDGEMSSVLQYLNLRIIGEKLCRLINKEKVTERNICTSSTIGRGICKGDAGDPVVFDGTYQVGIVSWGVALCGLGVPDVHTRVYSYVDWINGYISN
ncbi:chymotrypsin-2-like [Belonocnema kinseyi]|uniref:chymotrypsin-2-like n=1 Tax=Belonocnema kinseyi TaxID=2817044 RepID=UPI00143E08A8|nr:chymotrypsin-2-like [Belonocnema kinseyi]